MSNTPPAPTAPARVTFEEFADDGSGIREYSDGTEECFFSEAEWDVMLSDPAFGYVCTNGHRLTDSDRRFIEVEGICPTCYGDAMAADEDYFYAEEGQP